MDKQKIFNKICRDINSVKIQGAENIAKKAFYAYKLIPSEKSKKKLLSLRPTEPLLFNVLKKADMLSLNDLEKHFSEKQEKINKKVLGIIKNNSVIFTHCHSSTVINALVYAKKQGKKFEVYNTQTMPLLQGIKTAKDLKKANIKITMFPDSAVKIALTKDQDKEEKTKPVNLILIGADAITDSGVINKVGSGLISDIASKNNIPLYIITDSWKYSNKKIKLEQRPAKEIWNIGKNMNKKLKIKNPAFEFVPRKNIKGIISELGNLKFDKFLKKVKKQH